MATPTSEPAGFMVCFQFVTAEGSVIDSEPEPFPDIKTATAQADTWLKMKGQTIQLTTWEGFGVTLKVDALNLITAMPASVMAEQIEKNRKLAEEIYSGTGSAEPQP